MKAGYKQTEIGVIPEDWEVKSVFEIGQIKTGPFGTLLKANEYSVNDGVPLISVGEVGQGSFRVTENTPRVPERVVRRLPQYVLRTGDIVFGRKGAVERSALISKAEDGWFLGSDGISIRPSGHHHPPYLAAQFQSSAVQSWLTQNATGTTMPSLNQGVLRRVQIPLATESEQRAIATALSDVDALLNGLDRLIAKKRDLKQAAMQQLLTGRTRLPGFQGDWEKRDLRSEIAHLKAGVSVNSTEDDLTPEYPCVLKTSALSNGVFFPNEAKRIKAQDLYRAVITPKRDTILISRMNTPDLVGEIAYIPRDFPWLFLPDRLWMTQFHRDSAVNVRWLAYLLSSKEYKIRLKEIATGTSGSMKNISKDAILSLPIHFPTSEEQTAIAEVLSDMDAEITALEARRDKTRALKQGMMQELLTGRTRLI
ncbi:restriction endonuclease subunit S [Thiorhodococcus fuscus]|uniref:Restriction endonuclease subunit S n=1 Tax=Thiorhodococcus fuscus TaxID=527200 RepID=A0ABW4Y909_9GAMM